MGLIRKIFWFAVFVVATLSWVVLFEHGPSGFVEGWPKEFERAKGLLVPAERRADESDKLP